MRAADVELQAGEQLMVKGGELIYRQIAPHMLIDDGKVATTAFGPNSSDNYMPSYSRSTAVTAQESRDWHTRNALHPSLGVWGIAVQEVIASESYAVDDSACPLGEGQKRAPGHCFVDFRRLSKPQRKELRARLYMHAMKRGEIPTNETVAEGQLF
ncbi:hypothetical protein [Arthrobacter sp.]|uniref:hypothetical protein n=1 Tax=Arthrobacter sp. TaxID=1667 RepID=UPI003A8D1D9B